MLRCGLESSELAGESCRRREGKDKAIDVSNVELDGGASSSCRATTMHCSFLTLIA